MKVIIVDAPNGISAFTWSEEDVLQYELLGDHEISYKIVDNKNNETLHSLIAPKGFVTDLASVPKIPPLYAWVKECSVVAPTFHDLIYRTPTIDISKELADLLFKALLEYEGVEELKALAMYEGVDKFGDSSYKARASK